MFYHRETNQVGYKSKDGKETRMFDSLGWIVALCSHVPGKDEQMFRYYGHYSNVARGKTEKNPRSSVDNHIRAPDYPAEANFKEKY